MDENRKKTEFLVNYKNNLVIAHKIANGAKIGCSNTVTKYLHTRNKVSIPKKYANPYISCSTINTNKMWIYLNVYKQKNK